MQLPHEQLGYPRLPQVHAFLAECFADVAAVALLVLMLTPAQVLGRLPSSSAPLLLNLPLLALPIAVLRRVITIWLMVALAAGIDLILLPVAEPGRRNNGA